MIVDSQDREVLYRALGVQRYLISKMPFNCFARKLNERGVKEHLREKPVSMLVWSRKPLEKALEKLATSDRITIVIER